jgi:lipopolysaccharide export system permease protein
MGILFRYITREFLKIFFFCIAGIFVVFFAVHFFEIIRRYARYEPSWDALIQYFLLRIPQVFLDISPLAVLMAVVLTLGLLSRHHEIVAMRTSGISPAWITTPFLLLSLLISGVLMVINLSVLPILKDRTDLVKDLQIKKRAPDLYFRQSRIWLRLGEDAFMNVQMADASRSSLFGVNIYRISRNYSLSEWIQAERLEFRNGAWIAHGAVRRMFLQDGGVRVVSLDDAEIPLDRSPDDFMQIGKDTDRMTYQKLAAYTRVLEKEGYASHRYRVDLHTKTALPLIPFVFTLIGAPLALHPRMGRAVSRGIGLSLLTALAYWIVFSMCLSFGYGQVLPPQVAAWLPNLLFLGGGIFLMVKVNR